MDVWTLMIIAIAFVSTLSIVFVTVNEFLKFKLKKEQIKADTLIKTEEIKAKNQLDIEKLMLHDKVDVARVNYNDNKNNQDEVASERRNRLNERM